MKLAKDMEEFYNLNDKDVDRILYKNFGNILQRFSIEDIKNEIYERLISKKYIERYRPFRIYVDVNDGSWEFKPSEAKFSTYIYTFVKNYVLAYYGNIKPYENWVSLDEFNDHGYSEESERRIRIYREELDCIENSNFKIDVEEFLKKILKKNKNRYSLYCENELELSIAKYVDEDGDRGCFEKDIIEIISKKNNVDFYHVKESLDKLVDRKVITKHVEDSNISYKLGTVIRRNIQNLFKYYIEEYKDKEISKEFNMTVAGVGALKRSLRREAQSLYKNWKS